jgi:two-component system, chemotaxis family, sensor kinase CheA
MDELLTDFLSETTDLLDEINGAIVAWEADPADRERLDLIFRFVHTVKGSSSFLALPRVTALAHAAEDALDKVRRGTIAADTALVTAVLRIIDRIAELCAKIGTDGTEPAGDDSGWLAPVSGVAPQLGDAAPSGFDALDGDATLPDQGWRSIRVPLPLLDSVMTGVTDMVLARNEVARLLRAENHSVAAGSAFDRLSACIAGMRASVSQMRMQRIGKLFVPLTRIVRDLAQDLGKTVELKITGGEVEIDREMIENIRDPLTHIVRNAIDHGLESTAGRKRAGKPLTGVLSISARQSGNQILIEIEDDGAGIAVDRLVAKAVGAKLVSAKDAALLSRHGCRARQCRKNRRVDRPRQSRGPWPENHVARADDADNHIGAAGHRSGTTARHSARGCPRNHAAIVRRGADRPRGRR